MERRPEGIALSQVYAHSCVLRAGGGAKTSSSSGDARHTADRGTRGPDGDVAPADHHIFPMVIMARDEADTAEAKTVQISKCRAWLRQIKQRGFRCILHELVPPSDSRPGSTLHFRWTAVRMHATGGMS